MRESSTRSRSENKYWRLSETKLQINFNALEYGMVVCISLHRLLVVSRGFFISE